MMTTTDDSAEVTSSDVAGCKPSTTPHPDPLSPDSMAVGFALAIEREALKRHLRGPSLVMPESAEPKKGLADPAHRR